jgi:osmotically-inducible protein OsmY
MNPIGASREPRGRAKSDAQIKHDVLEELKWDTRVKETDVGIEVHSGIVTITGTVDSWAALVGAQEAAHRVRGVLDVANDVQVRLPGSAKRTDSDIAWALRTALQWDVLVPDERIRSTVSNGVVTLQGTVDTWSQYDDTLRCVRNLSGVVEVRSFIRVEPPVTTDAPETLHTAIEQALERHAVDEANHVHIAIADGKVILSGDVETWSDGQLVEAAVRGTPGVRGVDNQLRIRA